MVGPDYRLPRTPRSNCRHCCHRQCLLSYDGYDTSSLVWGQEEAWPLCQLQ